MFPHLSVVCDGFDAMVHGDVVVFLEDHLDVVVFFSDDHLDVGLC